MTAVTLTNLTSGNDTTAGTSATTASITPIAGRVCLLAVTARIATGSIQPPTPTISGTNGWSAATWQLVDATNGKSDYDATGTDRNSMFLFYTKNAGGSAGTITISFGATTITSIGWSVEQSDANVDAVNPIVQVPAPAVGNNVNTLTVTLAAFGNADDAAYGFAAHQTTEATSAEATWTLLSSVSTATNSHGDEYKSGGSDLSVAMTWVTATGRSGLIALELAAAGGAATSAPPPPSIRRLMPLLVR